MAVMRGRSHRHRVPTARPPSEALGVVYLWGRGEIGSELRTYLKHENATISEHDDIARKLAIDHGCPIDLLRDAWAWRVDGARTQKIDELTRDDRAVMGWTQNEREQCSPSLALLNALNAVTANEISDVSRVIEQRFAKPGRPHLENDPNTWIARDDRLVVFDSDEQKWRLSDYACT